jgi:hypothetical protein
MAGPKAGEIRDSGGLLARERVWEVLGAVWGAFLRCFKQFTFLGKVNPKYRYFIDILGGGPGKPKPKPKNINKILEKNQTQISIFFRTSLLFWFSGLIRAWIVVLADSTRISGSRLVFGGC